MGRGRRPGGTFRSSIALPTDALVYASSAASRRRLQDSGSGWSRLLLSCRALASPATCRFIPALPIMETWVRSTFGKRWWGGLIGSRTGHGFRVPGDRTQNGANRYIPRRPIFENHFSRRRLARREIASAPALGARCRPACGLAVGDRMSGRQRRSCLGCGLCALVRALSLVMLEYPFTINMLSTGQRVALGPSLDNM
jgi:hypothetical protein